MTETFKTIGIIGRVRSPGVKETLKTLIDYLNKLNKKILVESETALAIADQTTSVSKDQLGKQCDLVIVVGGDGSLLNAAHTLVKDEVPVLGINRGSLGFLTDIHPTELSKIKAILDGEFILEKRFLLTATTEFHGASLSQPATASARQSTPQIHFQRFIRSGFYQTRMRGHRPRLQGIRGTLIEFLRRNTATKPNSSAGIRSTSLEFPPVLRSFSKIW